MPTQKVAQLAQAAWLETRSALQELRPELYRFCRHLVANAWDAEDLVQETLLRAFVALGSQYGQTVDNPRAWLLRIAANAWIDRKRRAAEVLMEAPLEKASVPPSDVQTKREAIASLFVQLSPHERVALVLKEVFEFSLDEIAQALGTSTGSVKTALHRARGKLSHAAPQRELAAQPALISAFCKAFNDGDLARLTALLLEGALIEIPGVAVDFGVAASNDVRSGILYHALLAPLSSGVPARFLDHYEASVRPRAELRVCHGESLLLLWYGHGDGEAVRAFARLDVDAESNFISRVRAYYYSPEALAEVAAELCVPFRSNGYGF